MLLPKETSLLSIRFREFKFKFGFLFWTSVF